MGISDLGIWRRRRFGPIGRAQREARLHGITDSGQFCEHCFKPTQALQMRPMKGRWSLPKKKKKRNTKHKTHAYVPRYRRNRHLSFVATIITLSLVFRRFIGLSCPPKCTEWLLTFRHIVT